MSDGMIMLDDYVSNTLSELEDSTLGEYNKTVDEVRNFVCLHACTCHSEVVINDRRFFIGLSHFFVTSCFKEQIVNTCYESCYLTNIDGQFSIYDNTKFSFLILRD